MHHTLVMTDYLLKAAGALIGDEGKIDPDIALGIEEIINVVRERVESG